MGCELNPKNRARCLVTNGDFFGMGDSKFKARMALEGVKTMRNIARKFERKKTPLHAGFGQQVIEPDQFTKRSIHAFREESRRVNGRRVAHNLTTKRKQSKSEEAGKSGVGCTWTIVDC